MDMTMHQREVHVRDDMIYTPRNTHSVEGFIIYDGYVIPSDKFVAIRTLPPVLAAVIAVVTGFVIAGVDHTVKSWSFVIFFSVMAGLFVMAHRHDKITDAFYEGESGAHLLVAEDVIDGRITCDKTARVEHVIRSAPVTMIPRLIELVDTINEVDASDASVEVITEQRGRLVEALREHLADMKTVCNEQTEMMESAKFATDDLLTERVDRVLG